MLIEGMRSTSLSACHKSTYTTTGKKTLAGTAVHTARIWFFLAEGGHIVCKRKLAVIVDWTSKRHSFVQLRDDSKARVNDIERPEPQASW